tara:strand:+ start:7869 stop:9302 length:1434 start_codon:yes stop_codon:yes gene_type:complete
MTRATYRLLKHFPASWFAWLCLAGILMLPNFAQAARIGDVTQVDAWEQARLFFNWGNSYVRSQWIGCLLIGACCGLLGSFIVVRRMALMGDMLSHAVLPGIVLGFLWNLKKDPILLLVGAIIAGLVAVGFVTALKRTTRLKQDASLGIVLGGFYAIGICLLSMVQRMQTGDKSGLSNILIGSAAAISDSDLWLIGIVTAISAILIFIFFKELVVSSFDPAFAKSIGVPERGLHYLLMALLSFAVVISIQAVGVVLVSALLIIPAATATLLTHRFWLVVVLAVEFGMISAVGGAFTSFLRSSLPTGPLMILVAATGFGLAFLCAPESGLIPRFVRRRAQSARIRRENSLKAIFHQLESENFSAERVDIADLVNRRQREEEDVLREIQQLAKHGFVELTGESLRLTDTGWRKARQVVRNHRLWELYLTHAADIAPDHVHDDAEKIEHVLGEEVVRTLEARFGEEAIDPHGREVPVASQS